MGARQRPLSLVAGACLVVGGGIRRTLGGAALAAAGSYLLYRGVSGRCPLCGWLRQAACFGGSARPQPEVRDERSLLAPHPVEWTPPRDMDAIDEASLESFPASDSPGYTGAAGTRSALTGDRDTQESPPSHVR